MVWLKHPAPARTRQQRKLNDGPYICLATTQALVREGEAKFELVTPRADKEIAKFGWIASDITSFFLALRAHNFKNSEWCESSVGDLLCDAYAMNYDEEASKASEFGLNFYFKFSVTADAICIQVVSCHV